MTGSISAKRSEGQSVVPPRGSLHSADLEKGWLDVSQTKKGAWVCLGSVRDRKMVSSVTNRCEANSPTQDRFLSVSPGHGFGPNCLHTAELIMRETRSNPRPRNTRLVKSVHPRQTDSPGESVTVARPHACDRPHASDRQTREPWITTSAARRYASTEKCHSAKTPRCCQKAQTSAQPTRRESEPSYLA